MQLHRTRTPGASRTPSGGRRRSRYQGSRKPAPQPLVASPNGQPSATQAPAPVPPVAVAPRAPAPVAPAPTQVRRPAPSLRKEVSGGALLLADLRTGFILINEARYRACERVLGLPREQANIASLIAAVALAEAAHDRVSRLLQAPAPTPGDLALGSTALKQVILGPSTAAAGPPPVFGGLVLVVLSARVVAPSVIRTARGIKGASRELGSMFARRYGRHARHGRQAAGASALAGMP